MSQEECVRLREGVPYVKIYRYNQKHLCPKLNGYGDSGQRKVWSSCSSTHCTSQLTRFYVFMCISLQSATPRAFLHPNIFHLILYFVSDKYAIIYNYKLLFIIFEFLFHLCIHIHFFSMSLPAHSGPRLLIQFRNHFSQTVGLLGRVISPSQGRYLNIGQHKYRINPYTHQTSMLWVRFGPMFPMSQRAMTVHACLRPRGYCDRLRHTYILITEKCFWNSCYSFTNLFFHVLNKIFCF
jgi:hypothetical protein